MTFANTFHRSIRSLVIGLGLGGAVLQGQLTQIKEFDTIQISPALQQQVVAIDLSEYFDYENLKGGTLVQLFTNVGALNIELFDEIAPNTVENFLFYLDEGRYTDSFIHRRSTLESSGLEVIQGGGYSLAEIEGETEIVPVETRDPIENEYNPDFPNVPYSISMAKLGGDPDSATSQWFINLDDNSEVLNENNNGGFTVFAEVIGESRLTVDLIGGLQVVNAGSPFGELPVINFENNIVTFNDLVVVLQSDRLTKFGSETELGLISVVPAGNTNSNLITQVEQIGTSLFLTVAPNAVGVSTLSLLVAEAGFESAQDQLVTFPVRVRSLIQNNATLLEGNWRNSSWLGLTFFEPGSSWAYTPELGWFFIVDSTEPDGHFLYLPGIGWVWSNADIFPALWSFSANDNAGGWWTFGTDASNTRWFYDHTAEEWVTFDL